MITTHAKSSFEEIMAHLPDGIFLSNGPADPFAVAKYAIPVIKQLLEINIPIFLAFAWVISSSVLPVDWIP